MTRSEVEIFDESRPDLSALANLCADPTVTVVDTRARQRAELLSLVPPPEEELLAESQRWVYYPWRRTVVALLGPRAFRRLRHDRNRNKVTAAEQDALAKLRVGVVGLSVGHAIAHALALEGSCGELRLADLDDLELSNLNRIPASVLDLGVNKAVLARRRIAELDPYLAVVAEPAGLSERTVDHFLDGLDLVIEECDSFDAKVLVREKARQRRIPVLMVTSDRGLLDVERYDQEPGRPLFHGLLGDLDAASLAGLSLRQKVPYGLKILDARHVSPRMAASLLEVGHTLTTWPQLGGDVLLGAATVAAAVRRLGRGERLPSGRVRVDLDELLDAVSQPEAAPAMAAVDDDRASRPPTSDTVEMVAYAAGRAPSGGNAQPWELAVTRAGLSVKLAPERTTAMDVAFRGSYVAMGAALYNARVAAAEHGILGPVELREHGAQLELVLRFGESSDEGLRSRFAAMLSRGTNRHRGAPGDLPAAAALALGAAAAREGGRLRLLTTRVDLERIAAIAAASDRIRLLTGRLHRQMMSELRWPGDGALETGIDVRSLGLAIDELPLLQILRRGEVMALLSDWNAGAALARDTLERVRSSSAIAAVLIEGDRQADYVRGGGAVESLWIEAEAHGLAVQPLSPLFLYATTDDQLRELSPRHAAELAALRADFVGLAGVRPSESIALILRLSHAPAATIRSRRRAASGLSNDPR